MNRSLPAGDGVPAAQDPGGISMESRTLPGRCRYAPLLVKRMLFPG